MSVQLSIDAQKGPAVVDVVTGGAQGRGAVLDRSSRYVEIEHIRRELDQLAVVDHRVCVSLALVELCHSAENHDLLAGDLDGPCVNDPKLLVVDDVVDGLPEILFNVEGLHFLDEVERELVPDPGLGLEALAANDEDVLVVEMTHREGLPRLLEVGQHDPLLALDREELAGVQTLHKRMAALVFISVGHSSEGVQVVLEKVDDVVGSSVEHVVELLEHAPILVQHPGLLRECFGLVVVAAHHVDLPLGRDSVPGEIGNVLLVVGHDGLSHVVHDLVRVNELGLWLQVEDSRQHLRLEVIFHVELAREVIGEEGRQLLVQVLGTPAASEREVVILGVH